MALTKKAQRFRTKMTNIILFDVSYHLNKLDGKIGQIEWLEHNKKGMTSFVLNVVNEEEYNKVVEIFNGRHASHGNGLYECSSVIGEMFAMELSKFENGQASVTLVAM